MSFAKIRTMRFVMTMVAPVGVASKYEATKPTRKLTSEKTTARSTTRWKDLQNCMAMRVGKTMRLEIRRAPSKRMPTTTTTEQRAENSKS